MTMSSHRGTKEDGDVRVIDVMNTNQRLCRGESSETESFYSRGRDSFEDDGSSVEIIAVIK